MHACLGLVYPSFSRQNLVRRCRFTLIEMLVVVAIISIIAAMLMPALQKSLGQARLISCRNNIKQAGTALLMYSNEYMGFVLPSRSYYERTEGDWSYILSEVCGYMKYTDMSCPANSVRVYNADVVHFGANDVLLCEYYAFRVPFLRYSKLRRPAKQIYCIDSYCTKYQTKGSGYFRWRPGTGEGSDWLGWPAARHILTVNTLNCDGSSVGRPVGSAANPEIFSPFRASGDEMYVTNNEL